MNPKQTTDRITGYVDTATARWGATTLRWIAALLWLGNIVWKRPPDFGRSSDACDSLCQYVTYGIEHPVLPGSAWLFENVISPNLSAFGWITILGEATLAILLMSGRYRRFAAVLGIVLSLGILAAVANAPGEWYWSYLLMMALHVAILTTTPSARMQSARAMAAVTVGFGAAMVVVHSGEGATGTAFTFFASSGPFPGDMVRNLFGGSVALGSIVAVVGVAGIAVATRLNAGRQRIVGAALGAVGAALFLTYGSNGLIIGLGSTTTTACVIMALGVALAVQPTQDRPTPTQPIQAELDSH